MSFDDIYLTRSAIDRITENTLKIDNKKYDIAECREILAPYFRKKTQGKVQIFYNFKGGTGKTTICCQTAQTLALLGFNVLAIDLDPQGHLSNLLRFDRKETMTMYDAMVDNAPITDCIYHLFDGLDIIPSNLSLTRIELPLSQEMHREEILHSLLVEIKDKYDFILIDTNPTISVLNLNAMFAADRINVVCETYPLSLNGLCVLIEELEQIFADLGRPLNLSVIANKFEVKTTSAQEVLGVLQEDYNREMYKTVIRKCEEFNVVSKKRMPIVAFSPKSSPAFEDILEFVREFIGVAIATL